MVDFFKLLFRRQSSSATAKERLKLVLLSDHLALSPDAMNAMKDELLEVVMRYCDIDPQGAEVTFEHHDHEIAMRANVPIRAVRSRTDAVALARPGRPELTIVPPPAATTASEASLAMPAIVPPHAVASPPEPVPDERAASVSGDADAAPADDGVAPAVSVLTSSAKRRRRRRRKALTDAHAAAKPAEGRVGEA